MEGALVAGVVAFEAIELFFAIGVEERVDAGGGHFDFADFDAVDGPGIAEEMVEECLLESAFGTDFGGEVGLEFLELVFLAGDDDDVF